MKRERSRGREGRGAAARHRQARRARAHPDEARPTDGQGIRRASAFIRLSAPRSSRRCRSRIRWRRSSAVTTSAGTARAIPTACAARRRRSAPACSRSWTTSMRSRRRARITRRRSATVPMETLQGEAGRALDPSLVDALSRRFFRRSTPRDSKHRVGTGRSCRPRSTAASPPWDLPMAVQTSGPSWVFNNISLATQEMRALYDVAQTLGTRLSVDDTMALLTSKLSRLVPGSCWVLYLHDVARGRPPLPLRVRPARRRGAPADDSERRRRRVAGRPANRMAVVNAPRRRRLRSGRLPQQGGRPFQSALAHPLLDGDELIGTLTIYHENRDPVPRRSPPRSRSHLAIRSRRCCETRSRSSACARPRSPIR